MGYNQTNNPFSRKTSPLNEGGYCAKSAGKGGCVTQKDGSWKVISNKTGKLWDANYSSKADAEAALRAYHAGGPSRISSSPLHADMTIVDEEEGKGESNYDATHGDKKGVSRKASPLNDQNKGYGSELGDMPVVDIEKGDAEGDPTDKNDMYHNSDVYDISFNNRTEPRPNMADLPVGSNERFDEYNRRGWAYDDTTTLEHAMKNAANSSAQGPSRMSSPLNAHMVNSWEEEDVKRGRKLKKEGHYSHAEALFDDAHGSYNWDGHNSTGAEHHGPSRKSKEERRSNRADKLREKAMKLSEESGAERGDEYDYENERVMRMVNRANKIDPRTGSNIEHYGKTFGTSGYSELTQEMIQNKGGKK